jgi:hypothetical protein
MNSQATEPDSDLIARLEGDVASLTTVETSCPDNGLLARLEQEFTTDEQRLFLLSFRAYLQRSPGDFVVDLDAVWEWMGFTEKGTAKKLLSKHFVAGTDYHSDQGSSADLAWSRTQARSGRQHGGHNRQRILMSVRTFKKLCMLAKTSKADTVRDYYLSMEEVLMAHLKEREAESVVQLAELNSSSATHRLQLELALADSVAAQRSERSRALVDGFDYTRLTYMMHLMTFPDGSMLVKVGITREEAGIRQRLSYVSTYFGLKATVLDVYPCEKNYAFEQAVLAHPKVEPYMYTTLINNKNKSTETFLLPSPSLYAGIKRMMQTEVSKYKRRDIREKQLDIREKEINLEVLKVTHAAQLETQRLALLSTLPVDARLEALSLMYAGAEASVPVADAPASEEDAPTSEEDAAASEEDAVASDPEATSFKEDSNGPLVRTYAPTDLTVHLEQHTGITQALRRVKGASYSQIKVAAKNCTVYCDLRWQLVPRDMANEHIPMPDTVAHQVRRIGLIAEMTPDGGRVLDVHATQKIVSNICGVGISAVSQALKKGNRAGGRVIRHWDALAADVQEAYLVDHVLPDVPGPNRSKRVYRTCVVTGVVTPFDSLQDLRKEKGVTTRTAKASDKNGSVHDGFTYSLSPVTA